MPFLIPFQLVGSERISKHTVALIWSRSFRRTPAINYEKMLQSVIVRQTSRAEKALRQRNK